MNAKIIYNGSEYDLLDYMVYQSKVMTSWRGHAEHSDYYWSGKLVNKNPDVPFHMPYSFHNTIDIKESCNLLKRTFISGINARFNENDGTYVHDLYGNGGYMEEIPVENCLYDHPDFKSFMATIIANPKDNIPRLVLSDWLEEHGDEKRAVYIRKAIDLYNNPTNEKRREVMLLNDARWHKFCLCSVPDSDYERGFWANVSCGWPYFVQNCGKIAKYNPIQRWIINLMHSLVIQDSVLDYGGVSNPEKTLILSLVGSEVPAEIKNEFNNMLITSFIDAYTAINDLCVKYANKQALTVLD